MKIFGIKLDPSVKFIHEEDLESEAGEAVNPERDYSSACHLYEDIAGNQYIGFDMKLNLAVCEMKDILKNEGEVYKL